MPTHNPGQNINAAARTEREREENKWNVIRVGTEDTDKMRGRTTFPCVYVCM